MDYDNIIFWFLCFSCLSGLVAVWTQLRSNRLGWSGLYLAILLIAVSGWVGKERRLVLAAATVWLVLVLAPGLMSQLFHRRLLQQRFASAYWLARMISWLHPGDGWRQEVEIVRALEHAQDGEQTAALAILKRLKGTHSLVALLASTTFYRVGEQWEELLAWEAREQPIVERHPQLLLVLLRARGETGDRAGLVRLYNRNRRRIARMRPGTNRDLCRLMLLAFCGKRALVERLFAGSLSILPPDVQRFWLATADYAGGAKTSARHEWELLLAAADPPLRQAIDRRLGRFTITTEPPEAYTEMVIEAAMADPAEGERFAEQKAARATQLLVALNVLVFGVEIALGGSSNPETLYRMGALFAPAVQSGEWWRLVASCFLHFGPLHLFMNMLALWFLGPPTENALGFRRFLYVYLLSGIGSMAVVMQFASGPDGERMTIGASGSVMGLVGATAALMLRGWWRAKASSARKRLVAMVVIVALQSVFDFLVPQVSMTAHLSGAAIGFVAALFLRDRLNFAGAIRTNHTPEGGTAPGFND